jgi:hypothetical protein
VAVQVEGTGYHALTNALGEYTVAYQPGQVTLAFDKTGYTPGRLGNLDLEALRRVEANTVTLWRLPPEEGVYLYRDHRYHKTAAVVPTALNAGARGMVYGVESWQDVVALRAEPTILVHGLPRHNARLHRLELTEVAVEGDLARMRELWTCQAPVPMSLLAIDQAEQSLLQVVLAEPLEAGSYALHWGAAEGDDSIDPFLHVFTVVATDLFTGGPVVEPEPEAAEEPEAAGESDAADVPEETQEPGGA